MAATVYWRPGCPYCARLLGDLDRIGLPIAKVNIWEDAGAAATVRAIAGGNETVPTVVVGNTVVVGDTAMVNPRAAAVLDAARRHAPDLLTDLGADLDSGGHRRRSRRARGRPGWASSRSWQRWAGSSWPPADPTTSYHLAPAVVAAAWPVGRRLRAGQPLPARTALSSAFGGALSPPRPPCCSWVRGALAGPAPSASRR